MNKINPCPFCGSEVEIVDGSVWGYAIHCSNCGADVIFHGLFSALCPDRDYRNELIDCWNKRCDNNG